MTRPRSDVRGAVANWKGNEYYQYSHVRGNDMKFGTHSIDLDDFANLALHIWGINELITELDNE